MDKSPKHGLRFSFALPANNEGDYQSGVQEISDEFHQARLTEASAPCSDGMPELNRQLRHSA
jgi:hypothetical protein